MKKFEVALKRIEYGYALVSADTEKEARRKAIMGEGKQKFFPDQDVIAEEEHTIREFQEED